MRTFALLSQNSASFVSQLHFLQNVAAKMHLSYSVYFLWVFVVNCLSGHRGQEPGERLSETYHQHYLLSVTCNFSDSFSVAVCFYRFGAFIILSSFQTDRTATTTPCTNRICTVYVHTCVFQFQS